MLYQENTRKEDVTSNEKETSFNSLFSKEKTQMKQQTKTRKGIQHDKACHDIEI